MTDAKAAVARHGIVIIRTIETELEPTIIAGAKSSMASSPRRLAKIPDNELDKFTNGLRRLAMRSCSELADLYTRLLTKLGSEDLEELKGELDGIGALFTWRRISKATEQVDMRLAEKGFAPVGLRGPDDISDNLRIELEEKWPEAFGRFRELVGRASAEMEELEVQANGPSKRPPRRARSR